MPSLGAASVVLGSIPNLSFLSSLVLMFDIERCDEEEVFPANRKHNEIANIRQGNMNASIRASSLLPNANALLVGALNERTNPPNSLTTPEIRSAIEFPPAL